MSALQPNPPLSIWEFQRFFNSRLSIAITTYNRQGNDPIPEMPIRQIRQTLPSFFCEKISNDSSDQLTLEKINKVRRNFFELIKAASIQNSLPPQQEQVVKDVFDELLNYASQRFDTWQEYLSHSHSQFQSPNPDHNNPSAPPQQFFYPPQPSAFTAPQASGFGAPSAKQFRPPQPPPHKPDSFSSNGFYRDDEKFAGNASHGIGNNRSGAPKPSSAIRAAFARVAPASAPLKTAPTQPSVPKTESNLPIQISVPPAQTQAPLPNILAPSLEDPMGKRMQEAVRTLQRLEPNSLLDVETVLKLLQNPSIAQFPKVQIDPQVKGIGKSRFIPPSVLNIRLAPVQRLGRTREISERLRSQNAHTVEISRTGRYLFQNREIKLPTEAKTECFKIDWIQDAIREIPKLQKNTELAVVEQDLVPTMLQVAEYNPGARIAVISDAHDEIPGGFVDALTPEGDLIRTSNAHLYLDLAKNKYYPIHKHANALCTSTLWLFKKLDGQLLEKPVPFTLISTVTQTFNPNSYPGIKAPQHTDKYDIEILSKNILASLYAAHLKGATTLLINPLGCGQHWHDPQRVVQLFLKCLSKYFPGCFERVCFTIPSRGIFTHFARAVEQAGGGSISQEN